MIEHWITRLDGERVLVSDGLGGFAVIATKQIAIRAFDETSSVEEFNRLIDQAIAAQKT